MDTSKNGVIAQWISERVESNRIEISNYVNKKNREWVLEKVRTNDHDHEKDLWTGTTLLDTTSGMFERSVELDEKWQILETDVFDLYNEHNSWKEKVPRNKPAAWQQSNRVLVKPIVLDKNFFDGLQTDDFT